MIKEMDINYLSRIETKDISLSAREIVVKYDLLKHDKLNTDDYYFNFITVYKYELTNKERDKCANCSESLDSDWEYCPQCGENIDDYKEIYSDTSRDNLIKKLDFDEIEYEEDDIKKTSYIKMTLKGEK